MTVCDELRRHLNETGESMRALSLRAGLNAKAVSDILSIDGLKPRFSTLEALSEATGRNLVGADNGDVPQTYDRLVEKLKDTGQTSLVSRVRWLMRKANWYGNRVVCRHDVIDFFESNNAASLGISAGSRSTYKSDILAAIDSHGARNRPRGVADIGGIWSEAYRAAKDAKLPTDCFLKAGPFFVYIFEHDIRPEAVTTETLARYFGHRLATGTMTESKCRDHVGNVVTLLGHLETNPSTSHFGFKAVASPFADHRDKFGMKDTVLCELLHEFDTLLAPWASGDASRDGLSYEDFLTVLDREEAEPVSVKKARFRASAAAKSRLGKKSSKAERVERRESKLREFGFLTPDSRWSGRTIKIRRGYAISLAKALVASHDTVVTSIAELLDPEYLRAAAEALSEANGGGRTSEYLTSVLKTMKKIAIGYLAAPEADIDEIRSLIRFYGTGRRGMSPRNKKKLREFTEPRIQATINLSGTVLKGINAEIDRRRKAQRKKTGKLPERIEVIDSEMARDIAAVVAHDILLSRAPRSANVIGARLEWIAFQDGRARITVPAPEVKGRSLGDPDYVVCLSESASRLLQDYMEKVRPILLQEEDKANPFLFPRQAAEEVDAPYRSILKRVTRLLFAHVGVRINPHLYRHLIGWIWLKQSIDNLPRVQRLLGHKTLKTTVEYYAELDETLVMDGWQNHLEDWRTAAA